MELYDLVVEDISGNTGAVGYTKFIPNVLKQVMTQQFPVITYRTDIVDSRKMIIKI